MIDSRRTRASTPEELTARDLTVALRRAGTIGPGAGVVSATASELGGARGVAGRLARLRLSYQGDAPDAPATVIVKFAAAPGLTHDLAVRLRLYDREAAFYRDMGSRAGIQVPRVYGSFVDAAGEPVLLLEDLAPAAAGDLVVGCSLERAAALIDELARMHACWWDKRELEGQAWLPLPVDSVAAFAGASGRPDAWRSFRRRFGRQLPAAVVALGDRMQGDRSVLKRLSSPPRTLVHGDLRINNVMFTDVASAEVRAVIDWQTAVRGRGAMDVATLFATSLAPSDRAVAERELLPAYHAALVQGGVPDYRFEACWADYRLGLLNQFSQIVFLAAMIDVPSEVSDDVGAVTGARLLTALMEVDLDDVAPPVRKPRRWLASLRSRAGAAAGR